MKKTHLYLIIGIICFILGMVVSIRSHLLTLIHFSSLNIEGIKLMFSKGIELIPTIITTFFIAILLFIIFLVGTSLYHSIIYGNVKKIFIMIILFLFLIAAPFVLSFVFEMVVYSNVVCTAEMKPGDYSTNILTGECYYGGSTGGCRRESPWYSEPGCNVSNQEKVDIFKKSRWYNTAVEECNSGCQRGNPEIYCSGTDYGGGPSCEDLILCDTVTC